VARPLIEAIIMFTPKKLSSLLLVNHNSQGCKVEFAISYQVQVVIYDLSPTINLSYFDSLYCLMTANPLIDLYKVFNLFIVLIMLL
jgi:hypothetical protein